MAEITDLSTGTVGPPVRCVEIASREWKEGKCKNLLQFFLHEKAFHIYQSQNYIFDYFVRINCVSGNYTPFNDPPQGEVLIAGTNVSQGRKDLTQICENLTNWALEKQ